MTAALDAPRARVQHSPMRRLACLVGLLAALVSAPAHAQRAADSTQSQSVRLWPALGLHYGSPLRFSAALGLTVDLSPNTGDAVLALVEPGQHGVEYSLGYLHLLQQFGSGYSLRASLLRTDGEPWKANPNSTYVGAEAQVMLIFAVGGRAGVYHRVSGVSGEHDTIATVGFSLGL